MENQNLTSQTRPRPALSQEQASADNLIAALVRQSFDIFHTYGKDPRAIENIILGFIHVLGEKPKAAIQFAFDFWLKEKSSMPTPAEIKYIIETKYKSSSASFKNKPETEEQRERFCDLAPEQKKQFEIAMANITKNLAFEKKDTSELLAMRCKQDYSHFNRMATQCQEAVKNEFINTHQKIKSISA